MFILAGKRSIRPTMRFQFPPDNPADAGPMLRSRLYERFVDLLPIVTYASLLWCGVVYFLLHRDTSDPGNTSELMHKLGGLTAEDLVAGRWWGLVGSAFIHYDFFHAVFNMYWLVKLGSLMERGLGSLKTAAFFIVAAFVSSSYQLVIGGAAGIGFSGVVYAMVGFMWGAWPRYTGFLEGFNGRLLQFFIMWQGLCFILTWSNRMPVANTAHISGMVFGLLAGLWACKGTKQGWYWLAACIAMILAAVGLLLLVIRQ